MKRFAAILAILLICFSMPGAPIVRTVANPLQQADSSHDWPYYGNDLGNMRYVDLDQITPGNVAQLTPAWIFHTGVFGPKTSFESQPIIVNGTLYVSSPHAHVYALDAATGALKWTYNPQTPPLHEMAICCGQTNRGVAVGSGKVFVGQLDANLVALDANTGSIVWKTPVDKWEDHWTETMAPQYVNGKVIIGASGGEFELRGHISAYDANTGKMLWRFYTVPGPGEVGHDTWAGDSWKGGSATVWTTPSVDPDLGLIYFSTGNAGPDLDGSERGGDNLFSASVVALDLNTGKYRWHFQEVHHDLWDYDGPQPTHLFTLEKGGQRVPAIGHANKNGYYFILDRRTGKPLYDVKEVAVPTDPSWQKPSPTQPQPATDPLIPHAVAQTMQDPRIAPFYSPPQEKPQVMQPGAESGPEWPPAAYSPRTKFSYIPAGGYEPWLYYGEKGSPATLGSTLSDRPSYPQGEHYGLFDALDTTTGKLAWQVKVPERAVSGVTVAGDLVFLGESNGTFNALDAKSGAVLWSYKPTEPNAGGANGAPAVYTVGGREYVVMAFGGNTQVRSGQNSPTGDVVIAFALPQAGQGGPNVVTAQPKQLESGDISEAGLTPPAKSAPPDALVIEIYTMNIHFYPDHLTARPGQKVAIHLENTEPGEVPHNFYIALPSGVVGTKGQLAAGEEGYFVFTAPDQPGEYYFWCDVGTHRFQGMNGELVVSKTAQAAGATGSGVQPGMPRTGAVDTWGRAANEFLVGLAAVVLLLAGVHILRRRTS
jgi:alcohol dehydrogenase (cytochrome c)